MLTESAAREALQSIAENDYAAPEGIEPSAFAREILPLLGSVDGELRERYVYGTLHRWIVHRTLDPTAIVELSKTLCDDDHLFRDIGAREGDSVHMRSFSVLLLAPIVYAHRQDPYLSAKDLDRILSKTVAYLDREQDLRGYISKEAWWAHGVAHAADVLGQLARCSGIDAAQLVTMLDAIARVATTDSDVFIFEEDARMATAAIEILKRPEIARDRIAGWLKQLVPEARWIGELPHVHHRYANARNVLRCLYFQGRDAELSASIIAEIESALASLPPR